MRPALLVVLVAPALLAGDYDDLAGNPRETTHITMSRELLQSLGDMPLSNATSLRVHSFTYDSDAAIPEAAMSAVRERVRAGGARDTILDVRSRDPQEHVEAFLGGGGLALIAVEPRELTIIEIAGATAGDVVALGRHFGLSDLTTGSGAAPGSKHTRVRAQSPAKLEFWALARQIESRFNVKRESIPMWLVKPFALGSALDLASWESATPEMRAGFHEAVRSAIPAGWVPFVESTEPGEATRIWIGGTGDKAQLLIASVESGEVSLVKVKAHLDEWTHERVRSNGKRGSQ